MKVAIFSTQSYDKEFFEQYNTNKKNQLTYFENPLNKDTVNLAKKFDAVCVFVNDKVDKPTVELLAKNGVQLIVLRSAGFNNVDISAAKENNIKVFRVPAYSPEAIAEHAVALILTLNRKTHKAYNRIRENNFSLEHLLGFNLHNKTVGVIGTGKTGTAFCNIMQGFGCKVLAYDIVENNDLKNKGLEYTTLDNLLQTADIISLHCQLHHDWC